MQWLTRLVHYFKKGGGYLKDIAFGQTLNTITDHPRVSIDGNELERIQENLRYTREFINRLNT